MPADFVPPQFNNPDLFGSYLRGQQGATAAAMAPLQMQGAQQELQTGALNLQQMKLAMQFQQMKQQALSGAFGEMGSGNQQSGQQSAPSSSGGIVNDGGMSGNFGFSPGGLSQGSRRAIGMLAPEMLKGMDEGDASALKAAQLRSQMPGSPLLMFQGFAADTQAGQSLMRPENAALLGQWPQLAKSVGQNPADLSDFNVRTVATLAANQHRGALQLPPLPMPKAYQTVSQGLGQSYQVQQGGEEPGKISGGASAMPTEKYDVGGNLVELPKAVGVARGLQPHDAGLLAAQQITPDAKEQAYQLAKSTGALTEPLAGRDPYAQAQLASYFATRGKEDGNTGLAMAAQQQLYKAQQAVLNDFTGVGGAAGSKLVAINTAVKHIGALGPLIDALGSGNVGRINQARQAYQTATGIPAPTNYQALANMATGEINTVVSGAGGGDKEERERLGAPFDPRGGPDVLKGAVKTAVTALAGKTDALETAWNAAKMSQPHGPFSQFLGDETKQALGQKSGAAPITKTLGGVTYTQENGKWFKQ